MRDVNANFIEQKNKQTSTIIRLYILEAYDGTNDLRFAEWNEDIVFDGLTYTKFPISIDQISENNKGYINSTTITLANVSRQIETYLQNYDLRGKTVRIKRVWLEHLDDPEALIEDVFNINAITSTAKNVMLTITSKLDIMDVNTPGRLYTRNYCQWRFKGTECAYAGGETSCNKTKQRCKELNNFERFGAFPSVPSGRIYIG